MKCGARTNTMVFVQRIRDALVSNSSTLVSQNIGGRSCAHLAFICCDGNLMLSASPRWNIKDRYANQLGRSLLCPFSLLVCVFVCLRQRLSMRSFSKPSLGWLGGTSRDASVFRINIDWCSADDHERPMSGDVFLSGTPLGVPPSTCYEFMAPTLLSLDRHTADIFRSSTPGAVIIMFLTPGCRQMRFRKFH